MPQLYLLRHAKSSWATPLTGDHKRPLAPRGEQTAPLIAEAMIKQEYVPDLVLCSTAVRAQQTLSLILKTMQIDPPTHEEPAIYEAAPQDLIDLIASYAPKSQNMLLVGHNPAIHYAAAQLSAGGDDDALRRLEQKYPTAGLAAIEFDITDWRNGDLLNGQLKSFITPKSLAASNPTSMEAE